MTSEDRIKFLLESLNYKRVLSGTLFFLLLISCSSEKKVELVELRGSTMGTYYRVKLYTDKSPAGLKTDIDKFLKLFNKIFSTYDKDSEISQMNSSKFKKLKISDSMKKALILSLGFAEQSKGHFDITVSPLVNAWGFGPNGKNKKPTDAEISKILETVGHQKLQLQGSWLLRSSPEVTIDMSAIAKGFGVDELVKFLEYRGYGSLLVEIGGEVRTRGVKKGGREWSIGIEGAKNTLGEEISYVVPLKNMSIATSGSYRNFLKYGDQVFSHTINAKTGHPISHKTVSVSVLSEYCADADAWATALMSMGGEAALQFANENSINAYIQVKNGNEMKILMTKAFKKYMNEI